MKKTWIEGGGTVPATKKTTVKIYWMLMNVEVWNSCCGKPEKDPAKYDLSLPSSPLAKPHFANST